MNFLILSVWSPKFFLPTDQLPWPRFPDQLWLLWTAECPSKSRWRARPWDLCKIKKESIAYSPICKDRKTTMAIWILKWREHATASQRVSFVVKLKDWTCQTT